MTPKQILDSFSETLMGDERILSAQERALLVNLLHHARTATTQNQETQEAVRSVIASAVGETVAQRAFTVLGESIVERILENGRLTQNNSINGRTHDSHTEAAVKKNRESTGIYMGSSPSIEPQSPGMPEPQAPGVRAPRKPADEPASPEPQSPGVRKPHKPPHEPAHAPMGTPEPQSPGFDLDRTSVAAQTGVAVAERPSVLKAQCVILDEFLAPQEVEELMRFTLANENNFTARNTGSSITNIDVRGC
jgi:hypothetical protein